MKQKCFNLITQSGWSFTKVLELCLFCQRNSKRRIKSVSLGFLRLKSPETVAVGHRDERRRDVLRALWVLNHWARFLSLVAPLRPPSDLSYLSVSKTEIDGNVFFAVKMKGHLLTVIKCKSLPSWRWHMLERCIYLAARRVSQVHSCCSQEHRFPLHPLLRSTLPRRSTPVPIPKRFLHSFSFSSCVILNWMSVKCKSNLTCFPNFQSSIFHKKQCFYCVLEINFNL